MRFIFCVVPLLCVTTKSSGISDFWAGDYKVFEKVYGKTSDKDLYSDTLPISYTNLDKYKATEASEKKEHVIDTDALTKFDPYSFKEKYAKLFAQQILDQQVATAKPAKSYNFISYNSKPISLQSDPETYKYLKHMEQYDSLAKEFKFPKRFLKPHSSSGDTQIYRSIQDILEAHEANKSGAEDNDEDREEQIKYIDYGSERSRKPHSRNKPDADPHLKPRCRVARCRKRSATGVRVRPKTYISRITQNRWSSG